MIIHTYVLGTQKKREKKPIILRELYTRKICVDIYIHLVDLENLVREEEQQ